MFLIGLFIGVFITFCGMCLFSLNRVNDYEDTIHALRKELDDNIETVKNLKEVVNKYDKN